jgi:hypothetical protein
MGYCSERNPWRKSIGALVRDLSVRSPDYFGCDPARPAPEPRSLTLRWKCRSRAIDAAHPSDVVPRTDSDFKQPTLRRPGFWSAPGAPFLPFLPFGRSRGEAERREAHCLGVHAFGRRGAHHWLDALAFRRSAAAFLRDRTRGPLTAPGPRLRAGCPAVQRSSSRTARSGRRAGPRGPPSVRLTRPDPRAPHLAPSTGVTG